MLPSRLAKYGGHPPAARGDIPPNAPQRLGPTGTPVGACVGGALGGDISTRTRPIDLRACGDPLHPYWSAWGPLTAGSAPPRRRPTAVSTRALWLWRRRARGLGPDMAPQKPLGDIVEPACEVWWPSARGPWRCRAQRPGPTGTPVGARAGGALGGTDRRGRVRSS